MRAAAEVTRGEGVPGPKELDQAVAAARTGDPDAIAALLKLIRPTAVRYCRARIGDRDLTGVSADDIAQEVCLTVLKSLPDFEKRGGSFLYLVRSIAANKVADAFRAAGIDEHWSPVSELEPRVRQMLASLPPLYQEVLRLRIIVGMTATETAAALGISAGAVRVTQYRALTRLRTLMGGS
ncbi:sigma factor-like helix-turn-helix DNA-binding protein [Amycolatopsis jejuensis]|uniref:sigma factor-like helix-turn-helix DNA-binding protein n=1 Tax=Amycolatopsis jejuensis TaxID=330084 RepID=UPI0006925618